MVFLHDFSVHVLNTYYVIRIVLGTGDWEMREAHASPHHPVRETAT